MTTTHRNLWDICGNKWRPGNCEAASGLTNPEHVQLIERSSMPWRRQLSSPKFKRLRVRLTQLGLGSLGQSRPSIQLLFGDVFGWHDVTTASSHCNGQLWYKVQDYHRMIVLQILCCKSKRCHSSSELDRMAAESHVPLEILYHHLLLFPPFVWLQKALHAHNNWDFNSAEPISRAWEEACLTRHCSKTVILEWNVAFCNLFLSPCLLLFLLACLFLG